MVRNTKERRWGERIKFIEEDPKMKHGAAYERYEKYKSATSHSSRMMLSLCVEMVTDMLLHVE